MEPKLGAIMSKPKLSIEIVNVCTEQSQIWNEATTIFIECSEIKDKIGRVQFTHCPREANGARGS